MGEPIAPPKTTMICIFLKASGKVLSKLLSQSLHSPNEYFKYSNNMALLYSKNHLSKR